ncbi:TetR family transcriptional regulator C-terminal domain-containing protein [Burkholderia cepacia]|uniref:TetR family transcriptional regulator C-terminal domain-containing protein n=1 Tax=Burkholderia cepacia TaxID=292 RepID=UPI0019E61C76|nr:TetR family transcriptional regulator C-terminal domain-containing protein [Burkholderia cepacia]MCA7897683.1 TetR family transcriptional regulator C-terminal domain-containing protein [Burkholderia cepacia]MCA7938978.1 TetR family transcriptional regulator C-terminal domain-containing protein [Burkholderia cepacia]NLA16741.1 TetR family transcriptional regulator [Burkholderia cepacia]
MNPSAPTAETPARPPGRREALRDTLEAAILAAAEESFSTYGFEGSSVAAIAAAAGLSKQNLMYYFPTKLALYRRVLDDVLRDWLGRMREFAAPEREPAEAMSAYIRAKLEFSRNRPHGSRVFALEIIGGAKTYGKEIRKQLIPVLRDDIRVLERWIDEGKVRQVDAEHLFFLIWAATQSYADFASQMLLVLGKRALGSDDFDAAYRTISDLVLRALITENGNGGLSAAVAVRAR